jgi:iron complex transport system ATP-binding protein
MSAPLLAAEGIGCSIRGRRLLADVSLTLASGQLSVVVGPNGAGKSTLLKLLTGELAPSEGRLLLEGAPLGQVPAWRLACRRAVMMQAARLAFPFTAFEVAALGASGVGRAMGEAERRRLVAAALEAADVGHLAGRAYQTLSGGEQQRVQFARTLAQLGAGRSVESRQLLFLDEPVSSLDLRHQLAVLDKAAALAREGVAVLAVLHDLNLALAYADRLVVIHDGKVAADGAPAQVVTDRLLAQVFGVSLRLGVTPPAGAPFLLPQAGRPAAAAAA